MSTGEITVRKIIELDDLLCRYPLLELSADYPEYCSSGSCEPLTFIPIRGVQSYWEKQSLTAQLELFRHLVSSINRAGSRIAFVVRGRPDGIQLYYGCTAQDAARLQACLSGLFPGISLDEPTGPDAFASRNDYMGVMIGQPGQIEVSDSCAGSYRLPIDVLCSSMLGSDFTVMVLAERFPTPLLMEVYTNVRMEDQRVSPYQTRTFSESDRGDQENRLVQDYMRHLQMAATDLETGIQEGMWSASVSYSATTIADCARLESILKSAWMGKRDQTFQPLHCISLNCGGNIRTRGSSRRGFAGDGAGCSCMACLSNDLIATAGRSVLDSTYEKNSPQNFNSYKFRTALTTSQLSGYCQMPRHEYPGYAVDPYVEFDTASRVRVDPDRALQLGNVVRVDQLRADNPMPNPYYLDVDDLSRHLLVVGITGGGKSNTSKAILSDVWTRHKLPFLVIESAKREYHELMNVTRPGPDGQQYPVFPEISLFTLGDENDVTGIPYRLNPFEVISGCSIQTHIENLLATFKAAFELFPPMPYVLETMVYEVYRDRGWDIVSNTNRFGLTAWPTLTDLYYKIDEVTDRLGYHEEVSNNVKAALRARINSLRTGGKGAMMDVPRSIPLEELLNTPTVLELEDLGDDDTKSFVIGILMVQLYEYRKSCASSHQVKHLLIIEEAHRLLKKVPAGEGNQTKAKSVEFFCNMLSEIRSYGQAMMICDQVPTRLADDALKNTNCKIVHRTVMEEDRMSVGKAMHMNEEQADFLSSLPRGCAAVYAEGDSRPRLVRFPLVKQEGQLTRPELLKLCREEVSQRYAGAFRVERHSHACRFCEQRDCPSRKQCESWLDQLDLNEYWDFITGNGQRVTALNLVRLCRTAEMDLSIQLSRDEELCLIGGMVKRFNMSPLRQAQLLAEYVRIRGEWDADPEN